MAPNKSTSWSSFHTETIAVNKCSTPTKGRLARPAPAKDKDGQPARLSISPTRPKAGLMPGMRGTPQPTKPASTLAEGITVRVANFFSRAVTAPQLALDLIAKLPASANASPAHHGAAGPTDPSERSSSTPDFVSFLRSCEQDADDQVDGPLRDAIDIITRTVEHFDRTPRRQPSSNNSLDIFEMEEPLCCTSERYVLRILKYSKASPCNFIVALIYLQRIHRTCPWLSLSSSNAQRLLLAVIMLASKFEDDLYYSNKYWGRIGEVSMADMNEMELILLGLLDFNCRVKREEYDEFVALMDSTDALLQPTTDRLEWPSSPGRQLSMSISSLSMRDTSPQTSSESSPKTTVVSQFPSPARGRRRSSDSGRFRRGDNNEKPARRSEIRAPQHTTIRRRRSFTGDFAASTKTVRETQIKRMLESQGYSYGRIIV